MSLPVFRLGIQHLTSQEPRKLTLGSEPLEIPTSALKLTFKFKLQRHSASANRFAE
jgi:hypothetical protein